MGASYGNAGFIASELIDPLATPGTIRKAIPMLLDRHGALSIPARNLHRSLPWMMRFALSARQKTVEEGRLALNQLLKNAVHFWRQMLVREGLGQHLQHSHYLRVWERAEGKAAALAEQRFYNDWNIEADFLDKDEVADIEPALYPQVSHAVRLPDAHRVSDPYQISQALFKSFVKRGGQFLAGQVVSLRPGDLKVRLKTASSELEFERVVVCAGVHSNSLLQSVGLNTPLMAERGYHLNFPNLHGLISGPVCSAERNVFLSPLEGGLRIVGFSELGGLDLPANPSRYDTLRHHLSALLPASEHKLSTCTEWMGMRPTLPDSLPVIDTHPVYPQIGFAFGHQHAGVTLAAVTAKLIADRISGCSDSINLNPYRVDRF